MTPTESRSGGGATSVAGASELGGGGGVASRIAHAWVAGSHHASRFMHGGAKHGVWLGVTVALVSAT
jgi:hypothetical protein